jgi:hypothetical protein
MTTIHLNGVSFVRNVCYCKIIKVFTIFILIRMPVTPISLEIHQKYSNGDKKFQNHLYVVSGQWPRVARNLQSNQT